MLQIIISKRKVETSLRQWQQRANVAPGACKQGQALNMARGCFTNALAWEKAENAKQAAEAGKLPT